MSIVKLLEKNIPSRFVDRLKAGFLREQKMPMDKNGDDLLTIEEHLSEYAWGRILGEAINGDKKIQAEQNEQIGFE